MVKHVLSPTTNILVTGVTGLIGGEIVRQLGATGLGNVWALVRPQKDADAATRFAERMCRSDGPAGATAHSDVRVLPGDITRPDWGLGDDDRDAVTQSVDIILHCAADTSFLCKESVSDTNVAGTRNLIDLARRCQRRPLIVYMSTATNGGKMSRCCLSEEEGCQPENEHHNDYTRSKAVAETLLRESGLPLLILRPTIVLSEGIDDRQFAQNILWFVPLLRRFGALPLDAASRMDLVPVSYVVDATIDLLRKPRLAYDCYHLSAGRQRGTILWDANDFVNGYYRRTQPLRLIPPEEWTKEYRSQVRTPRQRQVFFALRYYLPFLNMDVVYDNSRLEEELGDQSARLPRFRDYVGGLLDQISSRSALHEMAKP